MTSYNSYSGRNYRTKGYTSRGGYKKKFYSKKRTPYKRSYKKASTMSADAIYRAVMSKINLKGIGPVARSPRQNTVFSVDDLIMLSRGNDRGRCAFMPITSAIPHERAKDNPPDDRYRTSNDVYFTGVRLRFSVRTTETVRFRMVIYKIDHAKAPEFGWTYPRAGVEGPNVFFKMNWDTPSGLGLLEDGPFRMWDINRPDRTGSEPLPANGTHADPKFKPWSVFRSSDGTAFLADLARGERRPIADHKFEKNVMNAAGQKGGIVLHEVDWYVPIKKSIHYRYETLRFTKEDHYICLLWYDCPTLFLSNVDPGGMDTGDGNAEVASILQPSVTVYFR